ncbi:MAG: DUF4384 domain-containing protein [Prevotella sp.]|nr:DUF4384 domain-containing protein [Prevotella sp.]
MRIILLLTLVISPLLLWGQTEKTISGEYTYYADPNMSIKEATVAAIENARLQAIAHEFGTLLTQDTQQQDKVMNGNETNYFMQLNSMEVKGEWVRDISEPETTREILEDGTLVIKAKVEIEARALSNEATDFEMKVLRNGTDIRFMDTNFKSGDDLYLYLKTTVDGYVAVYLVDEVPTAYCLLPYSGDDDGQHPIKRNQENIFFSPDFASVDDKDLVDELKITCSDEVMELNQLYVIFSPSPFTKAIDHDSGGHVSGQLSLPRQLSYKDFSGWLNKQRARDPKMGMKIVKLKIQN